MKPRAEPRTSIRRRLLAYLALPVAVVLGIGSIGDLVSTEAPIRLAYDQALSDAAIALALNLEVDARGVIEAHVPQEALTLLRTDLNDEVFFRISSPDVAVVAGDADLPAVAAGDSNPTHQTVVFRGKPVRLATYRTRTRAGTVLVTVAETFNKRRQIRERLWAVAGWLDVVELLVVLGLVWAGVRLALKPLDAVGEQIARRSPRDSTPVATRGVPLELDVVIRRLNALLAAVDESNQAQRQFLDDAAHQLRTPLAGVLAQLDLLQADETDVDRRSQLALAIDAARRLERTNRQLLTLAKTEHRAHLHAHRCKCDLAAIAAAGVAAHVTRANAADVDLGAELAAADVEGVEWLLSEALDNLIDNALTYTPPGGSITVRSGMATSGAFLEVVDSGQGIPPEERLLVLSRFYRGVNAEGAGSGLGLAIVADIARQHDATLCVSAGPFDRGTRVRLQFPAHIA